MKQKIEAEIKSSLTQKACENLTYSIMNYYRLNDGDFIYRELLHFAYYIKTQTNKGE